MDEKLPIKTPEYHCQKCIICKHFFKFINGCQLKYETETLDDHDCIFYEKDKK